MKIKIQNAFPYNNFEIKKEMVKEQWQQLKMKFFLGYK